MIEIVIHNLSNTAQSSTQPVATSTITRVMHKVSLNAFYWNFYQENPFVAAIWSFCFWARFIPRDGSEHAPECGEVDFGQLL